MTWRRADEESPEKCVYVLAWASFWDGPPEEGHPFIARLDAHGYWMTPVTAGEAELCGVRYWQPISVPRRGTPHGNSDERTA